MCVFGFLGARDSLAGSSQWPFIMRTMESMGWVELLLLCVSVGLVLTLEMCQSSPVGSGSFLSLSFSLAVLRGHLPPPWGGDGYAWILSSLNPFLFSERGSRFGWLLCCWT